MFHFVQLLCPSEHANLLIVVVVAGAGEVVEVNSSSNISKHPQ